MCSERDSPLKRLYRRTHAKLTRLAGSGQLVWAAGCELSLVLVHARRPAWPGETSETILRVAPPRKTRPPDPTRVNWPVDASASGSAQVGPGGRHRWAERVQVGQEPARQKAREGYPSHYTSLVQVDKRSHLVLFKQNQRNHDPYTSELQKAYKTDHLVNRHNMMGTVSKLYVSNNTWIYVIVYVKKIDKISTPITTPRVSTPIPTPTPGVSTPTPTPASLLNINSNSNSNSNSGSFNSNSNSGKSLEYQLQLQLRRFQLQFQLRSWSWSWTQLQLQLRSWPQPCILIQIPCRFHPWCPNGNMPKLV